MKGIVREGTQGFQKVVYENVLDTLPGGLLMDFTAYAAGVNGYMPEGTCLGRMTATGLGRVVLDPAAPIAGVQILGTSLRDVFIEDNAVAGVVLSGTARLKALPANEKSKAAALATALPRISFV
ncbi:hypothetical protein [Pedobacter antarcticus]|uniref:hypothetical protein n=1 Tax=Pedobacter antarcticus TaxID=34086 RepID=UPI001C565F5F|nr:hypothetical protein [Pedobacter antarcticus]